MAVGRRLRDAAFLHQIASWASAEGECDGGDGVLAVLAALAQRQATALAAGMPALSPAESLVAARGINTVYVFRWRVCQ